MVAKHSPKSSMSAAEYREMFAGKPHANPVNQHRGAQNKAAGAEFEKIITASCEYYKSQKLALIEKNPEPMKPIKHIGEGVFKAVFTEKAQCDYKGTLKGGTSVAFEAKHTGGDKINQNVVTENQTSGLNFHAEMGAECFVMVSLQGRGYFRVPWREWRDMKAIYGRKYLKEAELAKNYKISVKFFAGELVLQFLEDK